MKILFLADNFPPERNAQASRVYERARYWVRWGHGVEVITCFPNFPEGKVYPGWRNEWCRTGEIDGITTVRVKTFIAANAGKVRRILDFLSFMVAAFIAGLFRPRPDLVVATSPQFFAAVAGCALALVRRVPFVLEVSDLWPDSIVAVGAMRKNFALRWLEKLELFLYRRAARIVALTPAFKRNMVRRGVPESKIDVVINGVELGFYSPRSRDRALAAAWGLPEDAFVVGYIGTHGMAHALDNVLAAAELIDDPRIRLMLVGAGAERARLIEQAASRDIRNVVFVPPQPKEKMPDAWGLCDVALVHLKNTPLFQTVIPSKMFEAMGMGLPIVLAVPEGEASAILRQEGAGMWVPPQDPRALAQAVMLLGSNQGLRDQLAIRSRFAARNYTRERQANDMLGSLQLAVSTPGQAVKAASA